MNATEDDMLIEGTELEGCYKVHFKRVEDDRGHLAKPFRVDRFRELGLEGAYAEHFYSLSRAGVLRGMHFQRAPFQCVKLVYVSHGTALDVIVDVRRGSATFGRHFSLTLDADSPVALYIPPGIAHGFYVPSGETIMNYCYSAPYAPAYDTGIRWDSFGFGWPNREPIVSRRDRSLPPFDELEFGDGVG